jgi:undecaprenyl-diphosphatase
MLPGVTWPSQIQALDEGLLLSARGVPLVLAPMFLVATVVGGGWGLLALVPFAVSRATRAVTLWLLAAIVAQSAVVAAIKALVGRVRPCDALAWCAPITVASPGGHSFPSGHAAGSFAFAAFIAVRAPRFAALAFAWAALVAWSRCFLGVHYPSDVLAGALLGGLVGAAFARASLRARPPAPPPDVVA